MPEEERIEFIREHGTETMKKGLEVIFGRNKYKPIKEDMWKKRLFRGKKMVRKILKKQKNNGGIRIEKYK